MAKELGTEQLEFMMLLLNSLRNRELNLDDKSKNALKAVKDIVDEEDYFKVKDIIEKYAEQTVNKADAMLIEAYVSKITDLGVKLKSEPTDYDNLYKEIEKKILADNKAKKNAEMKKLHVAGKTNQEISKELKIDIKEVDTYIRRYKNTMETLRANNSKVK